MSEPPLRYRDLFSDSALPRKKKPYTGPSRGLVDLPAAEQALVYGQARIIKLTDENTELRRVYSHAEVVVERLLNEREDLLDQVEELEERGMQRAYSKAGQNGAILSSSLRNTLLDEIKKHIVKGSEAALEPTPPDYLLVPYIIRGALHELVGKQKESGKTTFVLRLAKACLEGGTFLGAQVQRTGVLYLTEQPAASFRQALIEAGLLTAAGVPDGFHIMYYFDVVANDWPDVARAAADYALEHGVGLLVVDTLPQFAKIDGDGENTSGAALGAMKPLQEAAHTGLAVIGGRHERKGGGSVADAGRGSSAFSGAVDMILRLKRPDVRTRSTVRELQAIGRFPVPESAMVELTSDGYAMLGSEADVQRRDCEAFVLRRVPAPPPGVNPEADDVAEEHYIKAKDLEQVAKDCGFSASLLQDVLKSLADDGRLCRRQLKSRGSPYAYWKNPSFLSSRSPIPIEDERKEGNSDPITASDGQGDSGDDAPVVFVFDD